MKTELLTPVAIIILVVGVFSLAALILQKICSYVKRDCYVDQSRGAYECGYVYDGNGISYLSEQYKQIAMFVVLELVVAAILVARVI